MVRVVDAVLGFFGSATSVLLWLPQARRIWRLRADAQALAGVSLGTQLLLAFNAVLWAAYAIAVPAPWAGLPSLFNLPLALLMMTLIVRARSMKVEDTAAG